MPTVSIGCKLPAGLHLNIFTMTKTTEPVMGGGVRDVERAEFVGRVTIRGSARRDDTGFAEIAFGYGITPNVDADVWAEWLRQNQGSDVVRNGLVFAHAKHSDVVAQAKASESFRSGLESVDPYDLPPEFKRKIETATEKLL